MNPDSFESATFSFRIRLPSTHIQRIRIFFNPLSTNTLRVDGEIFESRKKKLRIQKYPDTCGRGLSSAYLEERERPFFSNFHLESNTGLHI